VDLSRALPPHPIRDEGSPSPMAVGPLTRAAHLRAAIGQLARIGRPRRAWVTTAVRKRPSQVTQDERLRPRVTNANLARAHNPKMAGEQNLRAKRPRGPTRHACATSMIRVGVFPSSRLLVDWAPARDAGPHRETPIRNGHRAQALVGQLWDGWPAPAPSTPVHQVERADGGEPSGPPRPRVPLLTPLSASGHVSCSATGHRPWLSSSCNRAPSTSRRT